MKIWLVRLPISRGGQTPHSYGSRSPALCLLVLQVVALPIDPTNCVIFPAVHTLSPADIIRCPRQLRNINVRLFQKNIHRNIPKIKNIPKEYLSTDLLKGSTVWWNTQLPDGLENRELESKKEPTVDCHNVCPVVDRYKWYCETGIV